MGLIHAINPYVAGAPLRGERGFFGRQDTLEWVAQELRNTATNALVLFGQRRIGKTSLLLRLQHTLLAAALAPTYFDLQDQAARPLGSVLADLADTAAERAGVIPPSADAFDNQGQYFSSVFLPHLYQGVQPRRPVFLLDEFDVLDQTAEASLPEIAAGKALIPFLRRVMSEDPLPAFVFVVGRRAEDLSLDLTATFKASLAYEVWVLDKGSAELLVRQAEANRTLCFTDRAVARILSLTNCHPYLTQLLCQRIWERAYIGDPILPPVVDVPDVESTVADTLQVGNQALVWLWNGMSPAERIYAAALAEASEEGQVIAEDRVIKVLATHAARLRTREVELAPHDLVGRRVLEAIGQREYRFAIELFRRWVRMNKPLRNVKDELDRIEPLADRLFKLGQEWFEQRRWERATHYFKDALEVNPRHFCARLNLGEALLELRQNDAAVKELEQAYQLDRDEARLPLARALVAQAQSHDLLGDADGALSACEYALQISPGEHEAQALRTAIWRRRAEQALQSNDLETAKASYQAAGELDQATRIEQLINSTVDLGQGIGESETSLAGSSPEELLQAYYLSLANECRRLPLDVIDPTFVDRAGNPSISLPDVYVDLDGITLDEEEEQSERTWALRLAQGKGRRRTSLLHIIARRKSARLVILGPIGSGKTCFVNNLTFLMATHSATLPKSFHDRLVVRFELREVAAHHVQADARGTADVLWGALRDDITSRLGKVAADHLVPHLQDRLIREGGLFILDGLDQVPKSNRRRQVLLEAIQELSASLPKNASHVLVTARPHAYADKQLRLPGYSVLGLTSFDREQVDRLISRWHQAMRSGSGWDEATLHNKSKQLQMALKQWPYLVDLSSRPLLLTLMATMHSTWQLPEDRPALYEEIIRLLIIRWQKATEAKELDSVALMDSIIAQASASENRVRAFLEPLALAVHQRQQDEWDRDETTADISISEITAAYEVSLGALDPITMLEFLTHHTGLVVDRGEGVYAFTHHVFQEYLAACYLAKQPNPSSDLRQLVYDDPLWWREVGLSVIWIASRSGGERPARLLNALLAENPDEVADISETHWRVAAMIGQALVDLRLTSESEAQSFYAATVERVRRWLL